MKSYVNLILSQSNRREDGNDREECEKKVVFVITPTWTSVY